MSNYTKREDCDSIDDGRLKIEDIQGVSSNSGNAEGIIVGDLWGYISDVNDEVVGLLGAVDKKEFVGKHVLEFLVKEERERAVRESLDTIARNQGKINEYRVRTKDGREMKLKITTDFVTDKKGERIGFIDFITRSIEKP